MTDPDRLADAKTLRDALVGTGALVDPDDIAVLDWLSGEAERLREERTDALTANDLHLFYDMLNDRQRQAEADGIGRDEPSSVYRLKLLDQLRRRVIREREREAYQITRLRDLLARLEWAGESVPGERIGTRPRCPVCRVTTPPHDRGCWLAAALGKHETAAPSPEG